jgi:hypothetical protein
MIYFKKHIIEFFLKRIIKSKTAPDKFINIPVQKIYPEFDRAPRDKKVSFLESAKELEQQGILKLVWEKQVRKKRLKSLTCINRKKLFKSAGKTFPEATIQKIKKLSQSLKNPDKPHNYEKLLDFVTENLTLAEIERGINETAFMDFTKLIKVLYNNSHTGHASSFLPSQYSLLHGITPRALSVKIYGDSGRIKSLKSLFSRVLTRARKQGIPTPDFSFTSGSFPEAFISGKISFYFRKTKIPMTNLAGCVLGLPLETITKIEKISVIGDDKKAINPTVLTIENKETFYALASCNEYSCLLYTGGYPSRAVNTLARILSDAGFDFFHAGDVDPDGILILQELRKTIAKDITPVCMDVATFNKYRSHSRKLEWSMLHNTRLISAETRALSGIAELLALIESTGLGIEQEVIDYSHIATNSM